MQILLLVTGTGGGGNGKLAMGTGIIDFIIHVMSGPSLMRGRCHGVSLTDPSTGFVGFLPKVGWEKSKSENADCAKFASLIFRHTNHQRIWPSIHFQHLHSLVWYVSGIITTEAHVISRTFTHWGYIRVRLPWICVCLSYVKKKWKGLECFVCLWSCCKRYCTCCKIRCVGIPFEYGVHIWIPCKFCVYTILCEYRVTNLCIPCWYHMPFSVCLFLDCSSTGEQQQHVLCRDVSCCWCGIPARIPACRVQRVPVHGKQDPTHSASSYTHALWVPHMRCTVSLCLSLFLFVHSYFWLYMNTHVVSIQSG